jgi:hypothetical protein
LKLCIYAAIISLGEKLERFPRGGHGLMLLAGLGIEKLAATLWAEQVPLE